MIYGIIPARLESTRLPRKLLLAETGKPLIQHTWEAVMQSKVLDEVIVATDSDEIAAAVRGFGGRAEMTGAHSCGTDRVAEVARRFPDAEIVVNVQGDEPEIDPRDIAYVVFCLQNCAECEMATLSTFATPEELRNPNRVKVLRDMFAEALYFTRQPVPNARIHCGIYAYRSWVLEKYSCLEMTSGEEMERLEQLRLLEHGSIIVVGEACGKFHGIDTPEDYARFVERWKGRQ